MEIAGSNPARVTMYPIADFYEPLKFEWTKNGHRLRQAAKKFLEGEEQMEEFTLFWGGPFSQWNTDGFDIDGVHYCTAEQWMMASKARLFGDDAVEKAILETTSPSDQKALGKMVKGFDKAKWEAIEENGKPYCWNIVYQGNSAKFRQNPGLMAFLLETVGTTLVEASPYDKIWGIGLGEDDPDAKDRSKWKGINWLGDVLTHLRDDILRERFPAC